MESVSFTQAFALVQNITKNFSRATQRTSLFNSAKRIIAEDIIASRPLPPLDTSAMDGYAILLDDWGKQCVCDGKILAGDNASQFTLTQGHTYKVMTGSMLPLNTQAVVQFEWTQPLENNLIAIPASITHNPSITMGQNIRFKGEEIKEDSVLVSKGQRLSHLDLSLIASQGINEILTYKPLKIAVFSSGDEVIEPHELALPHQIYNTNATSIMTLLQKYAYDCEYKGILSDCKESLQAALDDLSQYDVIITSGGASVGDADLLKETLLNNGATFIFDGINVKPGRHLAIAQWKDSIVILLPGNPLALLLHLHTLILPLLESLQGGVRIYPQSFTLTLDSELKLNPNTTSIVLGTAHKDTFHLYNRGKIGSSSLGNMRCNNAIAVFNNVEYVRAGAKINVLLYNADFCDIMDFVNHS